MTTSHQSLRTVCLLIAAACTVAGPAVAQNVSTAPQQNAAAFELMQQFRRGVNLGNFLEVPRGQDWGDNSTTADDFEVIAAQGFDHVRIPIGWHHYTGPAPDFRIEESFLARVEEQLDLAQQHDLAAVINIHHFHDFINDPEAHRDKLLKIWQQLAARFQQRPLSVAYEILNEPNGAADASVMNPLYAAAVERIRQIDPRRLIIVGPADWNGVRGLDELVVPDDDRVAVTVHCYEPFLFSHQGATWTPGMAEIRGVAYPQPGKQQISVPPGLPDWVQRQVEDYNRNVETQTAVTPGFEPLLKAAAAWGRQHNRPIYVGEFGAVATADAKDRAAFYRDFRRTAEKLGLAWCVWDWKAGFRYWDRDREAPALGMQEALFGQP